MFKSPTEVSESLCCEMFLRQTSESTYLSLICFHYLSSSVSEMYKHTCYSPAAKMMRNMKRVAKEVWPIFCRAMVIIDMGESLNIFDRSLTPIPSSALFCSIGLLIRVRESQRIVYVDLCENLLGCCLKLA